MQQLGGPRDIVPGVFEGRYDDLLLNVLQRQPLRWKLDLDPAIWVGRELGDEIFERMGGDLTVSASRYAPAEDRNPQFTEDMRATRKKVDELLAEGLIDEAEEHMREQQWFLRLRGYGLRKLNQAYFAFRGRYAESPASVSPVGDQLKELRSLAPSVGDFIRHMASVGSVAEFEALPERARAGEL